MICSVYQLELYLLKINEYFIYIPLVLI